MYMQESLVVALNRFESLELVIIILLALSVPSLVL